MARTALILSILIAALTFASGCEKDSGKGELELTTTVAFPVDIPDGAQCVQCGMYVEQDGAFSAEVVMPDGEARFFCDIGDMLVYYESLGTGEAAGATAFVRDLESGGWVGAADAFFLAEAPVKTPMRYGIAAFKSRSAADGFRAEKGGGTIYTFAGILADRPYI